ncbi:MAG: hypothetical protein J0I15_03005 [Herbaspirillum huttiense]|uniref:hypothetical protein n=1 Tax=Herbaspirillum huttiense TaxID=863372 RepID=UPI001AC9FE0D|nr:hypothetical protein [Herbaspirillum huttiense]MBN9355399.1 hypothetical protein [Herbaspirillum huttiense]
MNLPRPDLAAESAAAQGARAPETPAAALLRPPGTPPAPSGAPVPDHIVADPGHVVEPDGTEDPLANADDGLLPTPPARPGDHPTPLPSEENTMHKPQDTPPVEVPPLDPTPPQDPIPHQNPMAGQR